MNDDRTHIDDLIERSSLGTEGARRLRRRTPTDVAQDLLDGPTLTTETRAATTLLADAALDPPAAARRVSELIRPLVVHYCRARLRPHRLSDQADAIADAACASIENDLAAKGVIDPGALVEESQLLSYAYRVANRHVRAALDHTPHLAHDELDNHRPRQITDDLTFAIDKLTDLEREIIVLRVAVRLSATETAEVLGLRPGAVRKMQSVALQKLRRYIR